MDRYFDVKKHFLFELRWPLFILGFLQLMYFIYDKQWSELGLVMLGFAALSVLYQPYRSYRRNKQQLLAVQDGALLLKGYKAELLVDSSFFVTHIIISAATEQGYHKMTLYSYMLSKADWDFLLNYSIRTN